MELSTDRLVANGTPLVDDVLHKLFSMRGILSASDLASAARVHKSWLGNARYWLYHSVDVTLPNTPFANAMWGSETLRRLVRHLDITLHRQFNAHLGIALRWAERNALIYSFGWLHLDGVMITRLSVNTGAHWSPAVVVMGALEGSHFMEQVRYLKLRGLHFTLDVPAGVTSLDLTGSSYLRFQRVFPEHLQWLCITEVTQIPLYFLEGVAASLTHLELHFSLLYKNWRSPDILPWKWPALPALHKLVLIGTRGENLHVGGSALQPAIIALSLCLFDTNRIPLRTTTIELEPPGTLTYTSAHRFLLQVGAMRLRCKRVVISCSAEEDAVELLRSAGLQVDVTSTIDDSIADMFD